MPNNRFEIKYTHRFTDQTDNGKAFKWLKDNLGSACDDAITNAVRFMYLPTALAEAGATRQEVEIEIKKAREYFNEKMTAALGSCERESDTKASSNGASVLPPARFHAAKVVPEKVNFKPTNGASSSTAAIEEDDDFVEIDEDKLMED